MSALTLRLPKFIHYLPKHKKNVVGDHTHALSHKVGQAFWFTMAFLLSLAAGPFTVIGVLGAVFSLSSLDTQEPLPNEA